MSILLKTEATLRERLRRETRSLHECLDARVSCFDVRDPAGLARFLSLHMAAFDRMARPDPDAGLAAAMTDLRARALTDLEALGYAAPQSPAGAPIRYHPVAMSYVVAGSRLGGTVLRTRWLAATDPAVRCARVYFDAPDYLDLWRAFCDTAGRTLAEGPDADRVVDDARRVFEMYIDLAERELEGVPAENARPRSQAG